MMLALRCMFLVLALAGAHPASAQQKTGDFHIVGALPAERVAGLMERIADVLPMLSLRYSQMRESEIVATVASTSASGDPIDLAILTTPGLGVRLANEGYLAALPIPPEEPGPGHWRQEVFTLFHDPAVVMVREAAGIPAHALRSRRDLVRFLEGVGPDLHERVGLVNVGIDSQGYAFATQDQLRSPLFWRIMRAFGDLDARIFDTNAELFEALGDGRIDLAYNVPLSQSAFAPAEGLQVAIFDDYVIALPWVAFAPKPVRDPVTPLVVDVLRREIRDQRFPPSEFWDLAAADGLRQAQDVSIGPELLIFQDPLKKTAILDEWFQSVTSR